MSLTSIHSQISTSPVYFQILKVELETLKCGKHKDVKVEQVKPKLKDIWKEEKKQLSRQEDVKINNSNSSFSQLKPRDDLPVPRQSDSSNEYIFTKLRLPKHPKVGRVINLTKLRDNESLRAENNNRSVEPNWKEKYEISQKDVIELGESKNILIQKNDELRLQIERLQNTISESNDKIRYLSDRIQNIDSESIESTSKKNQEIEKLRSESSENKKLTEFVIDKLTQFLARIYGSMPDFQVSKLEQYLANILQEFDKIREDNSNLNNAITQIKTNIEINKSDRGVNTTISDLKTENAMLK